MEQRDYTRQYGGYLYETHMHTSEGSACAGSSGAQMAEAYAAAGYTGIIITDHFFYGNTAVDRSLPWNEWVERFCLGYEHAKATGEKLGLQVFFGWEAGYGGPEFLVYGLDKNWLLAHPQIRDATVEQQLALVHGDGGIVIQAHPYREASYIREICLYPDTVDGVEAINASHSSPVRKNPHPEFNERALSYGEEHDLPFTAGSDQHDTEMLLGGMIFPERLEDIHDFTRAVMNREAIRLLDGTNRPFYREKDGRWRKKFESV